MERPPSVERVVEEKFTRLQEEKTEWVNMGSATHQVHIGLDDVVDTDTLATRFLPIDHPNTLLLDLGLGLGTMIEDLTKDPKYPFQVPALANYSSIFIPS